MDQIVKMERYYRFNSQLYDSTRWSFLFGRTRTVNLVYQLMSPKRILEVGFGTGRNLHVMQRLFPNAELTGIDASESMKKKAQAKLKHRPGNIHLIHGLYESPLGGDDGFDLILFSYCLSMANPGWDRLINVARSDLSRDGIIAVVDFNNSPFPPFKRWMGFNHVHMDGHMLEKLEHAFSPMSCFVKHVYMGLWSYFIYIGRTGNR